MNHADAADALKGAVGLADAEAQTAAFETFAGLAEHYALQPPIAPDSSFAGPWRAGLERLAEATTWLAQALPDSPDDPDLPAKLAQAEERLAEIQARRSELLDALAIDASELPAMAAEVRGLEQLRSLAASDSTEPRRRAASLRLAAHHPGASALVERIRTLQSRRSEILNPPLDLSESDLARVLQLEAHE